MKRGIVFDGNFVRNQTGSTQYEFYLSRKHKPKLSYNLNSKCKIRSKIEKLMYILWVNLREKMSENNKI